MHPSSMRAKRAGAKVARSSSVRRATRGIFAPNAQKDNSTGVGAAVLAVPTSSPKV
jgi:hypothetical protein